MKIGKFTITNHGDEGVWIQEGGGEGGQFSWKAFDKATEGCATEEEEEAAIDAFFQENF